MPEFETKDDLRVNPHLAWEVKVDEWELAGQKFPVRRRFTNFTTDVLRDRKALLRRATLGEFSLSDLGVPKPFDPTQLLPTMWLLNKYMGMDKDVIIPSDQYADLTLQGFQLTDLLYRQYPAGMSPFMGDVALFRDPEHAMFGLPLLKSHPIGAIVPSVENESNKWIGIKPFNRKRGTALAKVTHAAADLSLMNGFTDLINLANTGAIFYVNDLIREQQGKNLWDYRAVVDDAPLASAIGDNHRKIWGLAQAFNIVESFDGKVINGRKIAQDADDDPRKEMSKLFAAQAVTLEHNIIAFKQLMTGLLEGDRSEGLYATEYHPDQINFVLHYLFSLVKSGEYGNYFSDDQMRKLIILLGRCETKPHEYTEKTATQQSIFSSNKARLEDAFFALQAPMTFGFLEFSLNQSQYAHYGERVSSASRFSVHQLGLKSLESVDPSQLSERVAPKSDLSVLHKGIKQDPTELVLAARQFAQMPDADLPEFEQNMGTARAVEAMLKKYQDPKWRKKYPDAADNIECAFVDIREHVEKMHDVVRSTVTIDDQKMIEVIAELNERPDLQAVVLFDHHDISGIEPKDRKRRTELVALTDKDKVSKLAQELDLPVDADIPEVIKAWVRKYSTGSFQSGYAAIHLKGVAEIPKDIFGRHDQGSVYKYAQVRLFLDEVKDLLDRSREFYKNYTIV